MFQKSACATVVAIILSAAALPQALAAEPAAQVRPHAGWGSGLMTVSLVETVKKEGPVRGVDPDAKRPSISPVGGGAQVAVQYLTQAKQPPLARPTPVVSLAQALVAESR